MELLWSLFFGLIAAVLIGVAVYCFMVYYNTDEPKAERNWSDPKIR